MEANKILNADVLDIIFEGKNKAYGAYQLRKTYNSRMGKAMIATGSLLLLLFVVAIAANFINNRNAKDDLDVKDVEMASVKAAEPPPPVVPPPPKAPPPPVVNQVQFTPPVVKKDEEIVKPQEIQDIKEDQVISTQTIKSDITTQVVQAPVLDEGTKVVELPTKKSDENEIFTKVEIEAGFPGGSAAFKKYLERNLNANAPVENNAPPGTYTVIVKFVVSKSGAISDVTAETNLGYGMEQEAMKIIKKSPNWTPAQQNGSIVNAYRRQPITFVVAEE
jgi:protein TonB